jgi:acetyl-CoA carboxylase biotin carboxyl carrier protein
VSTTEELLALIDRLEALLERSGLAELEVQAGDLEIMLRKPGAPDGAPSGEDPQGSGGRVGPSQAGPAHPGASRAASSRSDAAPHPVSTGAVPAAQTHVVVAPLTGIYYAAPSPGAAPYVTVGMEIMAGQVIGLIEAMKLFNEIKSDAAGRVVRLHATDGALVRAKQPLIEIEPTI